MAAVIVTALLLLAFTSCRRTNACMCSAKKYDCNVRMYASPVLSAWLARGCAYRLTIMHGVVDGVVARAVLLLIYCFMIHLERGVVATNPWQTTMQGTRAPSRATAPITTTTSLMWLFVRDCAFELVSQVHYAPTHHPTDQRKRISTAIPVNLV